MLRNTLLRKVEKLDLELSELFETLKSYSTEQLRAKPDPDTWSPMQVLQHMLLSEKLSLAYCKKKLSFNPKLKKANFKTWLNGKLVNLALISPFKFKAPDPVRTEQLPEGESLAKIYEDWQAFRKELRLFMQEVSDVYIDKEVYKHPFGLRMSLSSMLDFYKNHFRRHKKQLLKRL